LRTRLGDEVNVNATEDELILDCVRDLGLDTFEEVDNADNALTEEVADLNSLATVVKDDVDGEVSINVAHLVLVALKFKEENKKTTKR